LVHPNILRLRLAFYNYGFKVKPADGQQANDKLKDWIKRYGTQINATCRKSGTNASLHNVVSFWWPAGERPILLHLNDCEYADTFGIESLKYRHRLTRTSEESGFAAGHEGANDKVAEIVIPSDQFRVLKRSKFGAGFAWPQSCPWPKPSRKRSRWKWRITSWPTSADMFLSSTSSDTRSPASPCRLEYPLLEKGTGDRL